MYRQTYKSGAQKGLETKMEYWKEKDLGTEFNILTAQALNLAVEAFPERKRDAKILGGAVFFFKILLKLRQDPELQNLFREYKTPKAREYPKPPKPIAQDLQFTTSGEKVAKEILEEQRENE